MVKQFVSLIAIQYGLTFCLYVCSLYEVLLHSPSRLSISLYLGMSYSVFDGLVKLFVLLLL